jgi:hypothetical protein
MTTMITGHENLICSFPAELETEDWKRLKSLVPPDFFLYAVMKWVFTGEMGSLNEVKDITADSLQNVEHSPIAQSEADALIHSQAAAFYQVYTDRFSDIIPEHFQPEVEISHVIFDSMNSDIYIIFDEEYDGTMNIDELTIPSLEEEEVSPNVVIIEDEDDVNDDDDEEVIVNDEDLD